MEYFETLVLGIVQGFTEFLPIGSSTHIRIFGDLFGWGDPGTASTAIIRLGTEAAVITHFAKDIGRIISHWFRPLPLAGRNRLPSSNPNVHMGRVVIFGTIPIGALGLLFQDAIETKLRSLYIAAAVLALFAVILGWVDRRFAHARRLGEMMLRDDVLVGFGQAMALIPGVFRSGRTITVGLLLEYTREAAVRVSFLLAIPAVILSGFFQLAKNFDTASLTARPTILVTIVLFAVGYAVIMQFLKLISTRSYMPFTVYRIVLTIVMADLLVGDVVYTC